MSILGPCMLEFQFSPETEWALVSHHRVLVVLLASPFHKRRFLKVASRKVSSLARQAQMLELELAWERREFQASSGYVSAAGEEVAVEEGVEERVAEERWSLWIRDLVVQPDPVDTSAPLFPYSF
ncbi:hypothetical protein BDM02DRAFT_3127481 [Thelephora ganbajun]|uniref:Uncharacterized protein n=1 Tax=Thelephora ganbajun TaxID=370292 RepID=A0ACB6ZN30_THEGA|nr:hypothetical protein BDM02DRAFT_3127481 [Thelephora ganbajun]